MVIPSVYRYTRTENLPDSGEVCETLIIGMRLDVSFFYTSLMQLYVAY